MRTGCHYLISLCLSVCETFVVFTDCESCTRPIAINPGSVEAREYGLTHRACVVARPFRGGRDRRAAVDFVVCVWARRFFFLYMCVDFFSSSIAHGLLQV